MRRSPSTSFLICAGLWAAIFSFFPSDSLRGASPTKIAATALVDIRWSEEDEKDLSRSAVEALHLEDICWQHAQSQHFTYHFSQRWMGERAAAESETYYQHIKDDFKISEDRWELRGHIFVFETDAAWKTFTTKSGIDKWSGGVTMGNEVFFLCPAQGSLFTGPTLPHELTHLVVNRFVRGQIPRWLNEGVAEQQSRKHFTAYTKPKGYGYKLSSTVVKTDKYIPLSELTTAIDYPADEEKVASFYAQSVRMVQFLLEDQPKFDFMDFLQAMADGLKFDSALEKVYGRAYGGMEDFEEKYKDYAIDKVNK